MNVAMAQPDFERAAITWRQALGTAAAGLAVLLAGIGGSTLAGHLFADLSGLASARTFAAGEREALAVAQFATSLLAFQISIAAMTVWFARRVLAHGGTRSQRHGGPAGGSLVAIRWEPGTGPFVARAVAVLLAGAVLYGVFVITVDRVALVHDLAGYRDMLRTAAWPIVVLAACIGAPVGEELLFRGLLYGTFSRSALGPVVSALLTSALWASLHLSYTGFGLAAIFVIGLYLAWLRERTGSLAAPMLCHAAYNSLITAALAAGGLEAISPV